MLMYPSSGRGALGSSGCRQPAVSSACWSCTGLSTFVVKKLKLQQATRSTNFEVVALIPSFQQLKLICRTACSQLFSETMPTSNFEPCRFSGHHQARERQELSQQGTRVPHLRCQLAEIRQWMCCFKQQLPYMRACFSEVLVKLCIV